MSDNRIDLPFGMRLEHLLSSPGPTGLPGEVDKPLENISVFDRLHEEGEEDRLEWMVDWVEHQSTCAYLMRHHGSDGLKRVLRGIAKACSKHKVHMGDRVAAVAGAMSLEVY